MRYKQDENFKITGPGLPESGAVSIGPDELEKVYRAGIIDAMCEYRCCGSDCVNCATIKEVAGIEDYE